ncbi:MAG: hypothetical protein EX271_09450 [Acidimicrobiales bacterium]|nr:hypothetical protein [Hyphomonadaceae bacterium]RZV40803.1 MAG: hypothetical protein EX271_09450 [Acidimicrobiales bacterium]
MSRTVRRKIVPVTPFLLAAALVLVFPVLATATQYYRLTTGTQLTLPVQTITDDRTGLVPNYQLSTPLNRISTSQLSGENVFIVNDTVYVFMSPGPQNIWYPYAISKSLPEPGCRLNTCLFLKGQIMDIARDSLDVRYDFETLAQRPALSLSKELHPDSEIDIRINGAGNATLKTLRLVQNDSNQNMRLELAPPGIRSLGAKIAPAINPPK